MNEEKGKWYSKSLLKSKEEISKKIVLKSSHPDIPQNLKNFYISYLKQRPAEKDIPFQNTLKYKEQKRVVDIKSLHKLAIPFEIRNKNAKVKVITDTVLVILLNLRNQRDGVFCSLLLNKLMNQSMKLRNNLFEQRMFKNQIKSGEINNIMEELLIIDCRYNYEFQGGHVKGAYNINDPRVTEFLFIKNSSLFRKSDFQKYFSGFKDSIITYDKAKQIVKNYLTNPKKKTSFHQRVKSQQVYDKKLINEIILDNNNENCDKTNVSIPPASSPRKSRENRQKLLTLDMDLNFFKIRRKGSGENIHIKKELVIVFYCEFSSARAPNMLNHLRSLDRTVNKRNYPSLYYPNIYLLSGGYCNFVKSFYDSCTGSGQKYCRMLDQSKKTYLYANNKLDSKNWIKFNKNKKNMNLTGSLFSLN